MIEGNFRNKILSLDELCAAIGPHPRKKKVIMCHGTFDIVHPGHVRHLMYAKGAADLLVVSLTCDTHVEKANFRPYIPQELRAMNLAALEMVDYVIIDTRPTPLENLKAIHPDYFAKGYEYIDGGIDHRSQEELDILESYGGEFIFTPGDVVFSSSAIIESSPPNLAMEKLLTLIQAEDISFDDLRTTLDKLQGIKVHVVGDTIVDSYTRTTLIGSNAKTPTFSVRYEGKTDYVGGAGIVAKHLKSAGADVTFTTMLGDDAMKDYVLEDMEKSGIKINAIIDEMRPTTNKNSFVADGHRMLKVDTLDNRSISEKVMEQFREYISNEDVQAVAFSDFRHGIFNRHTIPELIKAIPEGAYRVADSQVASRWGNILEFNGFDLITPNEKEARFSLADQDSVIRPLALRLYKEAKCKTLILKMGNRGTITYRSAPESDKELRTFFAIDSFVNNLVDAVGAGDALLAYATLSMVATGNELISSILGSMSAACECEVDGNIPITLDDIHKKIDSFEKRSNYQS